MVFNKLNSIPRKTRMLYWHRAALSLFKYICFENIWQKIEIGAFANFVDDSGQNHWSLCHFCRGHRLRSGFLIFQLFIDRLSEVLSRFRWNFAGEPSNPLDFGRSAHRRKCVFLNRAREYYILCMVCYWILRKLVSGVAKGHRSAFFNIIIYLFFELIF